MSEPPKFCPECAGPLGLADRFCGECGHLLAAETKPSSSRPEFATGGAPSPENPFERPDPTPPAVSRVEAPEIRPLSWRVVYLPVALIVLALLATIAGLFLWNWSRAGESFLDPLTPIQLSSLEPSGPLADSGLPLEPFRAERIASDDLGMSTVRCGRGRA